MARIYKIETSNIKAGVIGGLVAGVIFGAMMGMMGMLPMVAKLGNGEAVFYGFLLHLIFSVVIGILFSIFLGHAARNAKRGIVLGLIYGLVWWFLGPLLIMPLWLGMGVMLHAEGMKMALPSLWGHLVYGFLLGLVYPIVAKGNGHREEASA